MPLKQGFFVHHEAHEGHEEQTTGLKKGPDFNMMFSSFVLFVSFVVISSISVDDGFWIKYQHCETVTLTQGKLRREILLFFVAENARSLGSFEMTESARQQDFLRKPA